MSILSNKPVIGIDFDNTIIIYDNLFVDIANKWHALNLPVASSKQAVRDLLRKQENGEMKWRELQTEVYGRSILQAPPAVGVIATIKQLKDMPVRLKIVSHKTKFANTEKELNLRTAAKNWLKDNGILDILIPEDDIFFESTRTEKIQRVVTEKCDIFIDDLIEVFEEEAFPGVVKRVLFSSNKELCQTYYNYKSDSWIDIMEYIKNELGL